MTKGTHLPGPWLVAVTVIQLGFVAWLDLNTGTEISVFSFYFVPIAFVSWYGTRLWGISVAAVCTLVWYMVFASSGYISLTPIMGLWNAVMRGVSFVLVALFTSNVKKSRVALLNYAEELESQVAQRTTKLQERLSDLETFSYSMSHNLRAPLRALSGVSTLLRESHKDFDPEVQALLVRIPEAAARMDQLIMDMVAYTQLVIEDVELRPVCLSELVAEAVADHSSVVEKKEATVELEAEMPRVMAHNRTLHLVLFHLISNALKFNRIGTPPDLRVWTETLPDKFVRLWVQDNGIGISPAHRERIFNLFEQLHGYEEFGGTGIGLALVKRAVTKMGGSVGCEADPGKGSRFWIRLRSAPLPPSNPIHASPGSLSFADRKVLSPEPQTPACVHPVSPNGCRATGQLAPIHAW